LATTECFGPVLGLIRAGDLDDAILIQNSTDFGLTAGLHSLDPSEIERWIERVEAGNLYVNRGTTGAIVQRQPFGGWKHSVVGPAAKAGGPNYVIGFRRWHDTAATIDDVARGFERWVDGHLHAGTDPTGLTAEHNTYRYRPLQAVALRCPPGDHARAIAVASSAAKATGVELVVSRADDETDEAFADRLPRLGVDRLRLAGPTGDIVLGAAHQAGLAVDPQPPVATPDVELPRWLREQVVSRTIHRHGHMPD
jgi:RHH-type proline utilization regulon transcriptional repressor/proline dehydrogenase/delta 1-pyrroline-5-carboxylate dehydrogenase